MGKIREVKLVKDVEWGVKTYKKGTKLTPNYEFLHYLEANGLIEGFEKTEENKSFKQYLSDNLNERDYGSE